jgi:hypothetical protein
VTREEIRTTPAPASTRGPIRRQVAGDRADHPRRADHPGVVSPATARIILAEPANGEIAINRQMALNQRRRTIS